MAVNFQQHELPMHYLRNIRVPTGQIEFSTFSVSSVLTHSPSARCVIAANDVCKFLDIFGKNVVSFEDTNSLRESV
jgi:hypothetical protein